MGILLCGVAGACNVQRFGSDPDDSSKYVIWIADGAVSGQPATDGSFIYYGTTNHQLISVSRETGALRWQSNTDAATPNTLNGANIVLAAGNVVFGDYSLYAFDQATGSRRWVFNPEAQGIADTPWVPTSRLPMAPRSMPDLDPGMSTL